MRPERKLRREKSRLEEEYDIFYDLLTSNESTKMAKASSVNYFRRLFTENSDPPKYFDEGLIDVFIGIVRDMDAESEVRTDAAWALTNLLSSKRAPLTHTIIDKGTLDVFVWCIGTADYKLRDLCVWAVDSISVDCSECKEAVRATDVLEIIAKQLNTDCFHSVESNRCALQCCLNVLDGGFDSMSPSTSRNLLTAVTRTMRRFENDGAVMKNALCILTQFADERHFVNYPHMWPAQIDAMLNETGLVSSMLVAIGSDDPALVRPALRLIGHIVTGTDDQTERVILRDGFVPLMASSLESPARKVRLEAARILSNIAAGPAHHVDLVMMNKPLIGQLLRKLHTDEPRMQKEVCWVFANVLSNLNANPRPAQMTEFLGCGVLAIVDVASKTGVDERLVNKIREVLSALLIVHPEFWRVVEQASLIYPFHYRSIPYSSSTAGAVPGSEPILEIPSKKRRVGDYVIYEEDVTEI